jgi:hypothetical protein
MEVKTEKNNPCIVCGKEVIWGINGSPVLGLAKKAYIHDLCDKILDEFSSKINLEDTKQRQSSDAEA